jgi:L-alanine-DL-glutamate epimerase-like enolase superfamily enzyme
MRIIDIRQKSIPVASVLANSAISMASMTASAVAVVTDQKRNGKTIIGYGFDSAGRYAHGSLVEERLAPRLLAAAPDSLLDSSGDNFDPGRIWSAMMRDEKRGGHGERAGAVGLLDTAIWDAIAKIEDKPLWHVLAERYGGGADKVPSRIPSYATGGYLKDTGSDGIAMLQAEIRSMLDRGYTHVKIKVGATSIDHDRRRIEAALAVLGSAGRLAVDLNGTFDLAHGIAFIDAVAPYGLWWVEEIGDPLDYALQAEFSRRSVGALAVGENIFSLADATNLIRYGGLRPGRDILQFDVALSYGIVEYARILTMLEANGWSRGQCFPHAGHLLALHVVAGFRLGGHETAFDPSSFFGGYPAGCTMVEGTVDLPQLPGIGFESKNNFYNVLRRLA